LSEAIYPDSSDIGIVDTIADPLFKVISQASGLSINNIYRLHCIKEKTKKDSFTSGELAEEFGNTRRSMNRLIEKLEKAGYAVVAGSRMMADTGRPSRVIQLKW
jgi:DNA-binding MarR family transcriptional regulator